MNVANMAEIHTDIKSEKAHNNPRWAMYVAHRFNCIPTQNLNSPRWKKTTNMVALV
jgi:hypothetical protein